MCEFGGLHSATSKCKYSGRSGTITLRKMRYLNVKLSTIFHLVLQDLSLSFLAKILLICETCLVITLEICDVMTDLMGMKSYRCFLKEHGIDSWPQFGNHKH